MVTIEGFWRAHQIPLPDVATNKEHLALLESWMKSYKPEQLFADYGKLIPECRALVPPRDKRMSGNPQTNGGHRTALHLPPFRDYALSVNPGITSAGSMGNMAKWTRPARMGEYLPKDDPACRREQGTESRGFRSQEEPRVSSDLRRPRKADHPAWVPSFDTCRRITAYDARGNP